jgi:hypothetical protein
VREMLSLSLHFVQDEYRLPNSRKPAPDAVAGPGRSFN